jgi:hypothetical protein
VTWQFAGGDHAEAGARYRAEGDLLDVDEATAGDCDLVPPPEVGLPSVTPTTAQMLRPSPVM